MSLSLLTKKQSLFSQALKILHRSAPVRHKVLKLPIDLSHDFVYSGTLYRPSLAERLKDWEISEYVPPVNIGFSLPPDVSFKEKQRRLDLYQKRKKDVDLERLSRQRKLTMPLDVIRTAWLQSDGPIQTKTIAEHYNIYSDLFGNGYFYSVKPFFTEYEHEEIDSSKSTPVCYGNKMTAMQTLKQPQVSYSSAADSLWTLAFVNVDGHLQSNESEVLHWLVGNIPQDRIGEGELLCNYLAPFPPKGTGWHRCVFLLFKQNQRVDFSKEKREPNCVSLKERTFQMKEFYRTYQDGLTPAGLSFFQSQWDDSVQSIFHNVLGMKEPRFSYDWPKRYHPRQEHFPRRKSFNEYLEKYRDRKDINEEVLKKYLSQINPFEDYPKRSKYPLAHREQFKGKPTWYQYELKNYLLRRGKWSEMPF